MKKLIAILLIAALMAGCCCIAFGEDAEAKYDRLRVGTTTQFSGNFFSEALGNNVSDQDVRKLIHGYNLVEWVPEEGVFRPNQQVVTAFSTNQDNSTFIFAISKDLRYNDGTPITAKDYAFSFLMQTSAAIREAAGSRQEGDFIQGWKAYDEGTAPAVEGFRLMGDYQFSVTLSVEYLPYYYEMQALSIFPYPMSVLAPGIVVKDNGNGIYLSGDLTADMLRETLLDPENGYAVNPRITCGPYQLVSYDGMTVVVELNPEYNGDATGRKPSIPEIEFRYVDSDELINDLAVGDLDLVVRCARNDQIQGGLALNGSEDFRQYVYSRNGLAFICFCAEKGATADPQVRQALAMCMDKDTLKNRYLGSYGLAVDGFFGIGQWMYLATNGTLTVENEGEEPVTDESGNPVRPGLDVTSYPLNPAQAAALLEEAGWTLDEKGDPYDPERGGIRCKNVQGRLVTLKLKLIYPDNNNAGDLLPQVFGENIAAIGGVLELEALPMAEVLEYYYGIRERDCDMIMLGTNFGDVFEPTVEFDGDTHVRSGITDKEFKALALSMRKTEPGRALEYVQKWAKFLEYRSTILPEIPLYSNAYMDFAISALQDYAPASYSSWAEAVQYAILSDYVEPEEEELGEDEFIFD